MGLMQVVLRRERTVGVRAWGVARVVGSLCVVAAAFVVAARFAGTAPFEGVGRCPTDRAGEWGVT